jgi:hypothetical protein
MNMDDTVTAGMEQLRKELPWFAELIEKAQMDTSGEYVGNIWLEKYNGKEIFVTNMRIEDPLRNVFHYFDRAGNSVEVEDSELLNMKFNTVVYSNDPSSKRQIEIPDIDASIAACGVKQPQKNLPWLAITVIKAQADRTGNYWGWIWLESYNGEDVFVINMMLGSGGIMYRTFDCSGNPVQTPAPDRLKFDQMIYSNVPF